MDEDQDLQDQGSSPKNPADGEPDNAPQDGEVADDAGDGEGTEERLAKAEGIISKLKQSAGVKSVKEIEAIIERGKQPAPKKEPEKKQTRSEDTGQYVTREELALLQQGYSPDEIAVAQRLSPGKPLAEAVKDPTAAAAINGIRGANKAQSVTPEPSSRIPVHQNKSFGELKPAEKQTQYTQTFDKLVNKARQRGGSHAR